MGADGAGGGAGPSPSLDDAALLVLALRGPSSAAEVALAIGPARAGHGVGHGLAALEQAGLLERFGDPGSSRFALRPAGRSRCRDLVAHEAAALRAMLDASYAPFSDLNRQVKALLYRWQVRGEAPSALPNDHTDARYDAVVLADLDAAARDVGALLAPLIATRARYAAYVARMSDALAAARRGDRSRVAGIRADSFHAAWWELHADLLLMLGRERDADDA